MHHKYKIGDIVEIFDDNCNPTSGERAIVRNLLNLDDWYDVEFLDDPTYKEEWFHRFIFH